MGHTADVKDLKCHGKSCGHYLQLALSSNSELAGVVNSVALHSDPNLKVVPSIIEN